MRTSLILGVVLGTAGLFMLSGAGCGSSDKSGSPPASETGTEAGAEAGTPDDTIPGFGGGGGNDDATPPCTGLRCQQKSCAGGSDTTITGTVYAPNGTTQLYNAIVYVPNATPAPLTKGATCEPCGAVTGDPVVTALSGSDGTFTLKNVPVGTNIPLVIQIGKWRRQVVIPEVKECVETRLTDRELTRLPKKQSEGDMPRIAHTTGQCDRLGCMLPKIGIDPSEFGVASDGPSKAVHTYYGSGGGKPPGAGAAANLWNDASVLKQYDMAILSCECAARLEGGGDGDDTTPGVPTKNATSMAAMAEYLNVGGRIFTTHYMYAWYKYSPDPGLSSIGTFGGLSDANKTMTLDPSFPKGKALIDWLNVVKPGTNGKITADALTPDFRSANSSKTQVWARSPSGNPSALTTNVPVGVPAEQQCGKGVHIAAHVNNTDQLDASYPASCGTSLKDAENLLTFFFFDLASCIQDEHEAPQPPPVVK